MRIWVIGLGNIGGAITANFVEDGHDVEWMEREVDCRLELAPREKP